MTNKDLSPEVIEEQLGTVADSETPVGIESEGAVAEHNETVAETVVSSSVPVEQEVFIEEPNEPEVAPDVPQEVPVKTTNAYQEFPMNLSETPNNTDIINLPSDVDSAVEKGILDTPNVDLMSSPEARHWAGVVSDGLSYNTMNEVLLGSLDNPEAEFKQNNQHNGVSLNSVEPKFKNATGQNLKGERAMIRMITHMELGTIFQVMLWHSGISVTFKPPVESELIELNRQLMSDKIKFGRNSYGLIYSNTTVYSVERLMTFAIDHIYDLTTKSEEINATNIRKHISSQDIQLFLWGFICTMYPKGFLYERGCIADPDKCNHTVKETLNVQKLQYTNMKALTEWQKTFMSGRQSKQKTAAEVQRYKEELAVLQKRRVVLNEGMKTEVAITLRSPSVEEYIDAGHQWIDTIVENVEKVLGENTSPNERNNNIALRGQASAMRQYSQWVESLEIDGNIIDDRESIDRNLNILTADDSIRNQFIDEIIKYINHSTISIIGIPTYDCPKCGKTQEGLKTLPAHVNVIPLDVVQVFFGLISQKVEKIAIR